jgi:dTMP kinase
MFIVLEGLDGSGTTSTAKLLGERLDAIVTHEPTDGPIGGLIQSFLQRRIIIESPKALLALFLADRAEHTFQIIAPALARKKIVICDRYTPSTIVYQSLHVYPQPEYAVDYLNNLLYEHPFGAVEYNVVFYLQCSVRTAMERLRVRGTGAEFFETDKYLKQIKERYDYWASFAPNCIIVDAEEDLDSVVNRIYSTLEESYPDQLPKKQLVE